MVWTNLRNVYSFRVQRRNVVVFCSYGITFGVAIAQMRPKSSKIMNSDHNFTVRRGFSPFVTVFLRRK